MESNQRVLSSKFDPGEFEPPAIELSPEETHTALRKSDVRPNSSSNEKG